MKGCLPSIMGANASMAMMSEEKNMDLSPANARYFGLHNFGNTCYCNSVLQALFYCVPFREQVLQYRTQHGGRHSAGKKDSLLACLCDLFHSIVSQKKKMGVMQPKKFVARLRKENESFDNYMQHDAHEFFNHLLNSIHIYLLEEKRADLEKRRLDLQSGSSSGIKKERSSIFGRGRKAKKLHYHLQAMRGNGLDASFALTEPLAPQPDLDCSIESRAFTDDAAVLNSRANHREDKSTLMNGKTFAGSTSNINHTSPTKSASLSILNRIRSKKVSNTKLSEESDTSFPNTPKKQVTDGEEDGRTWIYDIFQGTYTTITRCLNCETIKNKDEDFLDLSVDIEQNTSITHCLRVFSHQQTLGGEHKYFCEVCRSKQEAEIEMQIKKLPTILVLHLKRFKYCDTLNKYTKLSYRVVFPFELRLFNTTEDAGNVPRLYDLIGVVVHCGSGPYRGHYISVVKSHGMWMVFDDDTVERMQPNNMEDFYGVTTDKNSESGYILFYQTRE